MRQYIYSLLILSLVGCTGKDTLVRPHEQKKATEPVYSLKTKGRDAADLSIDQMYALLGKSSTTSEAIYEQILKPLEQKMINKEFVSDPENTAGDFSVYLNLYTDALLKTLKVEQPLPQVVTSLDRFVDLTLKNCDEFLVDCSKVKVFSRSAKSSQLVVLKANRIGKDIDACIAKNKEESCQALIEKKYYLLLHSKNLNILADPNLEFIISYLEHSRLVERLQGDSFARRNHSSLYSTVVPFFDPAQTSTAIRCKVVRNFDVWKYSQASLFSSRQQMSKLFELAASCDLYDNNNELSESFRKTQTELQTSELSGSLTFFRRIQMISQNQEDRELFLKYLDQNLLDRATTLDANGQLDASFYDEYFFILDRLYNGHIGGAEEAPAFLLKANRSYRKLIIAFNNYVRIQLIVAVIDTKKYLNELLNKNTERLSSDHVFTNAIENSDSFAQTWRSKKSRFEDLFKVVRSVFQTPGLTTALERKSYDELNLQVRFLPSTIKFIATYPTMMSLAHFVAVQESEKKARAWWGGEIKYSASTIYEEMWKGLERPWLNFSAESEPLNKFYLVYAFDYAVRSDFVSIQREDVDNQSHEQKLQTYAKVLVQRYFKSERDALEMMYKSSFLPSVESEKLSTQKKQICEYELNPNSQESPVLNKNLIDLRTQIHSGIGKKSSTNYSASSINFFTEANKMLVQINDKTSVKLQMMKAFIEVMKHNKLPQVVIDEAQGEYDKINDFVNRRLIQFSSDYKFHSNCLLRMHLVEAFYQYLAFESEREYLSKTWDHMAKLREVSADKKMEEIKKVNDLPGVYADSISSKSNNVDLINFDKIIDDKTFLYSRFDILVRLKNLLTSGDIHNYMNPEITNAVGLWKTHFPKVMERPILLKREWNISPPPVLEQSDLLNNRDFDIQLYWKPSKEAFVRDGLKALSGVDGNSFVLWWSEDNNNDLAVWKMGLENLIYIYILQNQTQAKTSHLDAQDLISHMKMILKLISINDVDKELLKSFGYSSKFKIDKNLKDVVVDGGLRETLFPYSFLYDNFKAKIGMNSELLDPESVKKTSAQGALFAEAYVLSLNLTNQQYRVYFSTHEWLSPYLRSQYEVISRDRLQKIQDLADAFEKNKNFDDAETIFRLDEDNSGDLKPIAIKDYSRTPVGNNLVHPARVFDMNEFIKKFTYKTNNLYKTSDLGQAKDK